jgi:hypothetical protein
LWFLIKNNQEIAPAASGSSLGHFPFSFLSKTIRTLLWRGKIGFLRITKDFLRISKGGNCSGEARLDSLGLLRISLGFQRIP